LRIEGIRVYGFYGHAAQMSRNHVEGFDVGVRAAALNNVSGGPSSLWRVSDTIAVGAGATVDRSLRNGQSTFVEVVGNKP